MLHLCQTFFNHIDQVLFMKGLLLYFSLFFNGIIYFLSLEKVYFEEIAIISLVMFTFYVFLGYLYLRGGVVGRCFVVIGIILLSFNQVLAITTSLIYQSKFTYGIALSLLNTNWSEAWSMISTMMLAVLSFIVLFTFHYFVVYNVPTYLTKSRPTLYIMFLWLVIPLCSMVYYQSKSSVVESKWSAFFRNTMFFNFRTLSQAADERLELSEIRNYKADYSNLSRSKRQVKNLVLVIGESARRRNMSLYGYHRLTTPNQDKRKGEMKLYQNLVSQAGITLLSVPMLLSAVAEDDYHLGKGQFGDNILRLASHLDYRTYWLSTQEQGNMYVSTVSNIASFADDTKWFTDYDEVLLNEVDKILTERANEHNLIILHINGSHSNACDKYPAEHHVLAGDSSVIDCYDNSVRYTDYILGSLFNKLEDHNAALVYLSDHAEKLHNNRFIHSDSKEGSEIPYYIWYSPRVAPELVDKGKIDTLESLRINYYEIARLLGINTSDIRRDGKIRYLKSDLSVVDYEKLMQ